MQLIFLILVTNLFSFEARPFKGSLLETFLSKEISSEKKMLGGIFNVNIYLTSESNATKELVDYPKEWQTVKLEELIIVESDLVDTKSLKNIEVLFHKEAYSNGNYSIISDDSKGTSMADIIIIPSMLRRDIKHPFKKVDLKFDALKTKGTPHEKNKWDKRYYVTDSRIDLFHLPYLLKNKKDTEQEVKVISSMEKFKFLEKCSFTEKTCSFKLQNLKGKVVYEFINRLTDPNEDLTNKMNHHQYEKLELKNGMDFNRDGKLDFYLEEHYGDTHKTDIVFLISDPKLDKYEKVRLGSNNEDTFSLNYP